MRRLLLALAFAFAFASAFTVPAAAQDKPQTIKLERYRKALWTARVTLDGKTGDFLFDTGGGVTLVDKAFAKNLTCKFWGRFTGYNMFGQRSDGAHCDGVQFKAGDVALVPVNVGTIDFGDRFSGDKAPDGLLSLDAFDGKAITIDQKAATITIETPDSLKARTAKAVEVPFRVSRECSGRCLSVFMGVPTKDGQAWMILDSGAGGVSLFDKRMAASFGLDPEVKQQTLHYEVAPGIMADSPAMVTDMIMDGNLGQPFLSQYVLTMDLAHERAWLAKPN